MANGDIVSARINSTSPASLQAEPPHWGIIKDASGTPNQQVLWDTTLSTTIPAASLANTGLDVIENPDPAVAAGFMGRTVVPISPSGATTADPSGGTSREFAGIVLAVYKRTPIQGAPGSGSDYLLMRSGDLYVEDLASLFVVLPGM